jgi:1-phosphofructokinase
MEQYDLAKVVVSMGEMGALYVTRTATIYAEGIPVPVGSTVGAGDSVVAALAFAQSSGMSLEDTVRLSTATGAANVMCSGTQAAEYDVIRELLPRVVSYPMNPDFHRETF